MELEIYRTTEPELIERCKKRDKRAQKHLYEQYSSKLFALSCRYIKDKMEAEDILIISFAKIFEKINQYKGEGSFEGWMRRIVVNESLNYLRKNKSMYLEMDIQAADREPDYGALENQLMEEDLMRLIEQLPTGYRIVFNMYAIDGYSHKEIAEQLGVSESTSKSQLSRARSFLQRNLVDLEKVLIKNTN